MNAMLQMMPMRAPLYFAGPSDGRYSSMKLSDESARKLHEWAEEHDIGNLLPEQVLHVSVFTALQPCPGYRPRKEGLHIDADTANYHMVQSDDGDIVQLHFDSPELEKQRQAVNALGAELRYTNMPFHVTLTYHAPPGYELDEALEPPDFDLDLEPEILEPTRSPEEAKARLERGIYPKKSVDFFA